MPNRAKRAAARQSQLGQRRRKERKDRGLPNQPEATIAKPLEPLTSTIVAEDVLDEVPRVATQVSTPKAASLPSCSSETRKGNPYGSRRYATRSHY